MVARRVIEATVLAWTESISAESLLACARRAHCLHQVGEHALQRLILGQQLAELDALLPGEPGDLPAERAVVRGLAPAARAPLISTPVTEGRPISAAPSRRSSEVRTRNMCGRLVISRRMARKSPDAASRPATMTWMVPDSRSTSSRMCELNRMVRPSSPRVSSRSIMCSRCRGSIPLNGSSSSSSLRVVHQRRRHLDPLPHALGVGRDLPVLRVGHLHDGDGALRGTVRVGQLVQPGGGPDELQPGEERVDARDARAPGRGSGRCQGCASSACRRRSARPGTAPGTRRSGAAAWTCRRRSGPATR